MVRNVRNSLLVGLAVIIATLTLTFASIAPAQAAPVKFASNQTILAAQPKPVYPPGITAVCKDGTYSWSQHRKGTCSRHGGVKKWVNKKIK